MKHNLKWKTSNHVSHVSNNFTFIAVSRQPRIRRRSERLITVY